MLQRNDPRQYEQLAAEWWKPDGPFAMLHWLAASRGALIPEAGRAGAVLVDIGCGGGLNAPYVHRYHHIGVDIGHTNLKLAADHGVTAVQADARALPLPGDCADVVVAGEILEHIPDWRAAVAEACRVLRPGGALIVDTLADTLLCRFVAITLAERMPGGPPPGIHDPALFVPPRELVSECARHQVDLDVWGIRPAAGPLLRWLGSHVIPRQSTSTPPPPVPIVKVGSTSILYAGKGVKRA